MKNVMNHKISIVCYTGKISDELIPLIAKLRIEVFAEYPFLYAGNYDYETRYLSKFLTIKDAIVILAFDHDQLIGASTGYPFVYESDALKKCFLEHDLLPEDYFCFGESVLLKAYRGLGIGRAFFEKREEHVAKLALYRGICFYTSARPGEDHQKPSNYKNLAPLWEKRGFIEHPELTGFVSYQEIGEEKESPKKMVFWIKML